MICKVRFFLILLIIIPQWSSAQMVDCELSPDSTSDYIGYCSEGEPDPAKIKLSRDTAGGQFDWRGTLTLPTGESFPVAVASPSAEFYDTGIIETPWAWNVLSQYKLKDNNLSFSFDQESEAPPKDIDLRIIKRAREILSDSSVWDRADDRKCDPSDTTWSLYCALRQAAADVIGQSYHRQPALQVVRHVVAERGGDRIESHRLMDYNNHPKTTLAEIHAVLDDAAARILKYLSESQSKDN